MMWNGMDFICGICNRGWMHPYKRERQTLSCAPCGHVFHNRCLQKYKRTEDFCCKCGKPLDEALFDATEVIRSLVDGSDVSSDEEEVNKNVQSSLTNAICAIGLFMLIWVFILLWWGSSGRAGNIDKKSEADEIGLDGDIGESSESFIELDRVFLD